MQLHLTRTYHDMGTNGNMFDGGKRICSTIELPWRGNLNSVSCIPEGMYYVARRWDKKFGWHIWLPHVPFRQLILIHPANDAMKELKGCIAPVLELTGLGQGSHSRNACEILFTRVFAALRQEQVFLTIKSESL